MGSKAPRSYNAREVLDRLHARVVGPEGQGHRAFLFEEIEFDGEQQADGSWSSPRRADAISLDLWRSRGQLLQGYEVKVSRADWLNELQHPEKADPIVRSVHHFWLVTCDGVIEPNEVPEQWGILKMVGIRRHLKVEREAPRLDPPPINEALVVSMLRRVQRDGYAHLESVRAQMREEAGERANSDYEHLQHRLTQAEEQLRAYEEADRTFRELTGVSLHTYAYEKKGDRVKLIGKIVHAIENGNQGLEDFARRIRGLEEAAGRMTGHLNEALGELNEAIFGEGQAP